MGKEESPNIASAKHEFPFVGLLKDCAKKKDLQQGSALHADILERRILHGKTSPYVGSALISMYAKCGALAKAQEVLETLPVRNVVSWNALIAGYTQRGHGYKALNCFERMQREGVSPDGVTFTCILKACGSRGLIDKGKQIHEEIYRKGLLRKYVFLGNALVDMYAKCGVLTKARKVLDELPVRNVVTWNSLIAGYSQHEQGSKALTCFTQMQREGLSPDEITFTCILKACARLGDIEKGRQIHEEIVHSGLLEKNVLLGTALVDMYAKCGAVSKAQEVLEKLPIRDAVSWSALIAGYSQEDKGHEALNCFERMQREGISPDAVTFICILKACGSVGAINKGEQIHDEIVHRALLEKNVLLGNTLVDMYAKCGNLAKAQQVLEEIPIRDIVSWNALIAGYSQHEKGLEALRSFAGMQRDGLSPDGITFISILKAYGSTGAVDKGRQIHVQILSTGLLEKNAVLGTALVDMYAKCGMLATAQEVLEELPDRDVVSWSALIAGYAQEGQGLEALNCFEQMQREGLSPSDVIFISLLKACGVMGAVDKGKQIHDEIVNRGLMEKNISLGNALVDMYAKCGALAKAQEVLEELPARSVVSWNAIIAGYAQEERSHDALNCFARMQREGFFPNEITFTCILKACANIGAIDKGKQIHDQIVTEGLLDKNTLLGTALVDMYAKCGALEKAHKVLDELPCRNVASWNALISGYAQEGHFLEALSCFKQIQREGLSPNEVTFLCLLNACSHAGKFNEAQLYYEKMSTEYGIAAMLEHHTCMVVVFGSAGRFDKAISVIKTMPSFDDPSVWVALLGACWKWGNVELGKLAFDQVIQVDDDLAAAAYVLMANIYAVAGMQEDAEKIEAMRGKSSSSKKLGTSEWVDASGNVCSFSTGNVKPSQFKAIYENSKA